MFKSSLSRAFPLRISQALALSLLASGALIACGAEDPSDPDPDEGVAYPDPELDWELDDELDPTEPVCPEDDPWCDALPGPCMIEEPDDAPGSELMGVTDPKTKSGKYRVWPSGRIPYVFAKDSSGKYRLDAKTRNTVSQAMTNWEKLTEGRVRFREKTKNDEAWVKISVGGPEVNPFVGYRSGKVQNLLLRQGEYLTVTKHELGHVIGLHHEQKRRDRLQHILVKQNNIVDSSKCEYQFSACKDCALLGSYDVKSVMHYRSYRDLGSCRVQGRAVLLKLDGSSIDHEWKLSKKDLNSVALLYDNHCSAESNAQFCARHAKNCGSFSGTDNCGSPRTVQCGSCSAPDVCGGGGTANVCGSSAPIAENGSLTAAGVCADVAGGSSEDGARIVSWGCHGANNQSFRITKHRQLKIGHSLECAAVAGQAVAGAKLRQASCSSDADAQKFKFLDVEIVNGKTGECLRVPSSGHFSGQVVRVGACTGSAHQRFSYHPAKEEIRAGGLCLTPKGGAEDGNDVILRPCDGRLSQRWFQARGGFVNRAETGQCLRVEGGALNGTDAELSECNDALGQRWALRGEIRDLRSNLCVQASSNWDVDLELASCNGSKGQTWTFWSR